MTQPASPEREAEGSRRVNGRKVCMPTPEGERDAVFQAVDALFLGTLDKLTGAEDAQKKLWHIAQQSAYLQVLKMLRLSKHVDPDMLIQGTEPVTHCQS